MKRPVLIAKFRFFCAVILIRSQVGSSPSVRNSRALRPVCRGLGRYNNNRITAATDHGGVTEIMFSTRF
jgi:hypothetical protein